MKNYQKPSLVSNEELAEGVYMASGSSANTGCSVIIIRKTLRSQQTWKIAEIAWQHTNNSHMANVVHLDITFSMPVTFIQDWNWIYAEGETSNTTNLKIAYSSPSGANDVGNGYVDIKLNAPDGVSIVSVSATETDV